jgi:transcription-repair coupling factor (superfamily II helicase)
MAYKDPKKAKEYYKQYNFKRKDKQKEYNKNNYINNKEEINKRNNEYYLKNKEEIKKKHKKWRLNNKDKVRKQKKEKRKTNPTYRLINNLRRRILFALKSNSKSSNTMALLGTNNLEFIWKHLESTFKQGMTKENHGKIWHIDHIIPCSSFDMSDSEQQRKCFHYTNLQALFVHENLSKGAKIL